MSMIKKCISLVNEIIPKKRIVLFTSFPAFQDNALALYRYIIAEREDISDGYRLIWSQDEFSVEEAKKRVGNSKVIKKNSLLGYWYFIRAKYVISTHNYFSEIRPGKGQIQVNLWHGNGYKVIPLRDQVYRGDYTIGTGDIFAPIISDKLGIKKENVWITGLPRNDNIFHPGDELTKICDRSSYKKVVLWMPTYRTARFRHTGLDGDESEFGLRIFMDKYMDKVNQELADLNILLLIKPHPMDRMAEKKFKHLNNIIFFTNDDVDGKDIEMYKLLAETDALISDYSSVIVDYLLTDKPIGIVAGDIEQYGSNRGFVLNPVEDYLPGPIIRNIDEFKNFLFNIDTVAESWAERRNSLKGLFHKYQDDNSSQRVCDRIFGKADDKQS